MALTVHALASGSSGNSTLVTDGHTSFLIDAGIGIRRLVGSMAEVGVRAEKLSGIFITHEHSDHTQGVIRLSRKYRIPIIGNAETLEVICSRFHGVLRTQVLGPGEEITFGDMLIRPFETSHDAVKPVGYTIVYGTQKICYATDTGFVTPDIAREVRDANLVVLESNHDIERLKSGPYPYFLKERILGNRGHLSNRTAAELLFSLANSERPVTFWLAHLSDVNNTPKLAFDEAKSLLKPFIGKTVTLQVAARDTRSLVWESVPKPFQMALNF